MEEKQGGENGGKNREIGLTPDTPAEEGQILGPAGSTGSDICARCSMQKTEWSVASGVIHEGQTYCCRGCAENTGCVCVKGAKVTQEGMDATAGGQGVYGQEEEFSQQQGFRGQQV